MKELEANQLITQNCHREFPPRVDYAITEHGLSLEKVITELRHWGQEHRRKIIGK